MNLTQAMAIGTNGAAEIVAEGIVSAFKIGDKTIYKFQSSVGNQTANAALLSHCFNTLPGLVEAVNAIRDTLWCDHETGTCNMCQLREALRAAQEVRVP